MGSAQLPPIQMHGWCSLKTMEAALREGSPSLGLLAVACPQALATLKTVLHLVCECAVAGTLVCVADPDALSEAFPQERGRPCAKSSDDGYMTRLLRGVHVSDERFAGAFREYTLHSDSDRWPESHPDLEARGRPKDGAFLLSKSGYRVKCAVKLLGMQPAATWANVGTKHEAATGCAWAVQGSYVFVRSDSGSVHLVVRRRDRVHAYPIHIGNMAPPLPVSGEHCSSKTH